MRRKTERFGQQTKRKLPGIRENAIRSFTEEGLYLSFLLF